MKKHVSVEGQTVIGTCENGSLKYHKYQNIEKEVEEYTDEWLSKNRRIDCDQSNHGDQTPNRPREKPEADKDSDKSTETFHCVYDAMKK